MLRRTRTKTPSDDTKNQPTPPALPNIRFGDRQKAPHQRPSPSPRVTKRDASPNTTPPKDHPQQPHTANRRPFTLDSKARPSVSLPPDASDLMS